MKYTIKDTDFEVYTDNNILTIIKINSEPLHLKFNYYYCNEINIFSNLLKLITITDFNIYDNIDDNKEFESWIIKYKEIIFNYLMIDTDVTFNDFIVKD